MHEASVNGDYTTLVVGLSNFNMFHPHIEMFQSKVFDSASAPSHTDLAAPKCSTRPLSWRTKRGIGLDRFSAISIFPTYLIIDIDTARL